MAPALRSVARVVAAQLPEPLGCHWGDVLAVAGLHRLSRAGGPVDAAETRPRTAHWYERWSDSAPVDGHASSWIALMLPVDMAGAGQVGAWHRRVIRHLDEICPRTPEGAFGVDAGTAAPWALSDTVSFALPGLARAGLAKDDQGLVEQALQQAAIHVELLVDEGTGLCHHAREGGHGTLTPDYFSRANGYLLYGLAELLEVTTGVTGWDSERKGLLDAGLRHVEALQQHRHSSGLWHSLIVDDRDEPETSGSALIGAGALALSRHEGLPATTRNELRQLGDEVAAAAMARITSRGDVLGVAGEVPKEHFDDYRKAGRGVHIWGSAAVLLLGAEVARSSSSVPPPYDAEVSR